MKTKVISICACLIIAILVSSQQVHAQQIQAAMPPNVTKGPSVADYTYKIFQAPNSMYGYDIFRNGKIIFHQGASPIKPNDFIAAISSKKQAEKAAVLAIEKIKKNQSASLTQEELKKITAQ